MDLESILKEQTGNVAFCSSIYNSATPCLGVKIPVLRSISKSLTLQDVITLPYGKLIEYDIIKGLVIVGAKLEFCKKSKLLTEFACNIDSWATTDTCVLKVNKIEQREYFEYFCSLTKFEQPFCVRYGIVNLMRNYLNEGYLQQVLDCICSVKYGHYYVDMATAWLIAELAVTDSDKAIEVLTSGKLPKQVVKYALQKMRDSRRIEKAIKQKTYTLI